MADVKAQTIDTSNIQIINTVVPKGDSTKYTINFSLQADEFSISSGRVLVDKDIVDSLTEKQKPQCIIDKIKEVVFGVTSDNNDAEEE